MVDIIRLDKVDADLIRIEAKLASADAINAIERKVLEFSVVERLQAMRRIEAGSDQDLIVPIGRPFRV